MNSILKYQEALEIYTLLNPVRPSEGYVLGDALWV